MDLQLIKANVKRALKEDKAKNDLSLSMLKGISDKTITANLTVNELKRVAMDLSEPEVTRARSQMKAGLLMGLESPSSRAERLARMIQIWGKVPSLDETIEKIDSVNLEKVRAYAEHVASQAKFAMALYGPIHRHRRFKNWMHSERLNVFI